MDTKHFWICVSKEKENQQMTKDKQIEICKCRTERTGLSGTSCETELDINLWADLAPSDTIENPKTTPIPKTPLLQGSRSTKMFGSPEINRGHDELPTPSYSKLPRKNTHTICNQVLDQDLPPPSLSATWWMPPVEPLKEKNNGRIKVVHVFCG